MQDLVSKKVLVAAMDWGIGHATRCVPIISQLQKNGCEVILASHGAAKDFLKNYFPELVVIDKPGYNIKYYKNIPMTLAMLLQLPKLASTIVREHYWLKKIIRENKIDEVISDNCYGLWNRDVHSVFITHQLMVKCPGRLKFLENPIHSVISFFIKKYDECHIPDSKEYPFYSGDLSHRFPLPGNAKFIGTLSRFRENKSELIGKPYHVVILLSGPEPQRTILENKCIDLLKGKNKKCCFIRGLPGETKQKENTDEFVFYNHLPDDELKAILLNSEKIVCRSGYSTIMDLVELHVRALLIPTPGQTEQEYLAGFNNSGKLFESIIQDKLTTADLLREVDRPAELPEMQLIV